MSDITEKPEVAGALDELQQYLSDRVAPLMVVDSTDGCNTLDAIEAKGVLRMKQRPRMYYSASQRALI